MTDMQIVKVIVRGELPAKCRDCFFHESELGYFGFKYKCQVTDWDVTACYHIGRHSRCPLELEPPIHEYTAEEMMDDLGLLDDMEGEEE